MEERNLRSEKNDMGNNAVMFGAIAIILFLCFVLNIKNIGYVVMNKTKNLNSMIESGKEVKNGDNVKITIYELGYEYAETTVKKGGFIKEKIYHYIAEMEDGSVISIAVSDKDFGTHNKIESYLTVMQEYYLGRRERPEPLVLDGHVKKMNTKLQGYYNQGLNDYTYYYDLSIGEMVKDESKNLKPIYFEINTSFSKTFFMIFMLLSLVLSIIFGAVAIYSYIDYKKTSKEISMGTGQTQGYNSQTDNGLGFEDPVFNANFYKKQAEKEIYNADNTYKEESSDINKNTVSDNESDGDAPKSKFKLKDS